MIAWWLVLLCVGAIGVCLHRAHTNLEKPWVDSYVCVQAEGNRVPNPGCHSSKADKP